MWHRIRKGSLALASLWLALPAAAQSSTKAKIASALSAAPAALARNAAVKDWPDKNGSMATLRGGSNGWVCFPSHPANKYRKNDAMCIDDQWQEWMSAYKQKRKPNISKVGYAYMLSADDWASNTDMSAKAPTPENQWHKLGPHVMVLYPDAKMLEGLPTTPGAMGPYIMAPGSAYAHVMWPMR